MKTIRQKVGADFFVENGKAFLLTAEDRFSADSPSVYLRYALTMRGNETLFFPSVVLDDWGNEIKKLDLYRWLQQEGERFPRAEVFGVGLDGRPIQRFLRDLELFFKYPCYVYPSAETPIDQGVLVEAIGILFPSQLIPERIKCPPFITQPLTRARVQWWSVPPDSPHFDKSPHFFDKL